ncbi:hypothetical protein EMPS_01184 [Entomortierella parvispora]|uniref:HMG box domain-containing protein n=1 Tax=Entomortierella parvispora TaxID=205924 RepID=A0A9P3H2D0_9FUNG|nr:hypothetical protein EMPS_01184 [Entomortierella parvispora]
MPKVKAAAIPPKKTATSKAPPKKKMSAYNEFMKTELPTFKAAHPNVEHKEAFKKVAQLWKDSPLNPKRA